MATNTAPKTPDVTPDVPVKKVRYIAVTMTPELHAAIEKARDGKPAGTYLQSIIAKELNVTITAKQSNRGKYAGMSAEEKKNAIKADKVKQSKLVEMMMAKFADQMETLQKELEERMAKEAAEAAGKAA